MNYDSCAMTKVADEAAVRVGAPGAFCIVDVEEHGATFERMWVKFPHGDVGGFALEPAPAEIPGVWSWNESASKPTLRRPVRLTGQWSGRIEAGRMVSDSGPAAMDSIAPPPEAPAAAPAAAPGLSLAATVRRLLGRPG